MYKDVEKWLNQLPWWQQKVHRLLSFFGMDERGYALFGFYAWNKKNQA